MLAECPSSHPAILRIPRGLKKLMLGIITVGSLDGINLGCPSEAVISNLQPFAGDNYIKEFNWILRVHT